MGQDNMNPESPFKGIGSLASIAAALGMATSKDAKAQNVDQAAREAMKPTSTPSTHVIETSTPTSAQQLLDEKYDETGSKTLQENGIQKHSPKAEPLSDVLEKQQAGKPTKLYSEEVPFSLTNINGETLASILTDPLILNIHTGLLESTKDIPQTPEDPLSTFIVAAPKENGNSQVTLMRARVTYTEDGGIDKIKEAYFYAEDEDGKPQFSSATAEGEDSLGIITTSEGFKVVYWSAGAEKWSGFGGYDQNGQPILFDIDQASLTGPALFVLEPRPGDPPTPTPEQQYAARPTQVPYQLVGFREAPPPVVNLSPEAIILANAQFTETATLQSGDGGLIVKYSTGVMTALGITSVITTPEVVETMEQIIIRDVYATAGKNPGEIIKLRAAAGTSNDPVPSGGPVEGAVQSIQTIVLTKDEFDKTLAGLVSINTKLTVSREKGGTKRAVMYFNPANPTQIVVVVSLYNPTKLDGIEKVISNGFAHPYMSLVKSANSAQGRVADNSSIWYASGWTAEARSANSLITVQ